MKNFFGVMLSKLGKPTKNYVCAKTLPPKGPTHGISFLKLRNQTSLIFARSHQKTFHFKSTHSTQFRTITTFMAASHKYPNELRFDLSAAQISELCTSIIEKSKKELDNISSIPDGERTFANTVKALDFEK